MITEEQYKAAVAVAAVTLREVAETHVGLGWSEAAAFERACNSAAGAGRGELTIQQMTMAAAAIVQDGTWERAPTFHDWWNARFAPCPRVGGLAAPCLAEVGGLRAAIAATWSSIAASYPPPEYAQ